MIKKKTIEDIDIDKKNILIRIDIDSSLSHGEFFTPQKIRRYKDIFEHFIYRKAKVVVVFEMGMNRVLHPAKISIKQIIDQLSSILDIELTYFTGTSDKDIQYALEEILPGEILFFENLALNGEEEKENSQVLDKLSGWADYFVNDAFGVSARNYCSFRKIPKKKDAYSGMVMNREVIRLLDMLTNVKRPITLILGGLNIENFMLEDLLQLSDKVDNVLFTGAWVSYLAELSHDIQREDWMDKKNQKNLEKIYGQLTKKQNILMPVDVKVYKKYPNNEIKIANVPLDFIKPGLKIGDIGEETVRHYMQVIESSKLILWFGNTGKWWINGMEQSTERIAEAIYRSYAEKILIGDDLIESLNHLKIDIERYNIIHFGNGETVIKFLMKGKIIGVENLKDPWNI